MSAVEKAWMMLKEKAQAEANRLVNDFPNHAQATASALPMVEDFCNAKPPTTTMEVISKEMALSMLLSGFQIIRDHLTPSRHWAVS